MKTLLINHLPNKLDDKTSPGTESSNNFMNLFNAPQGALPTRIPMSEIFEKLKLCEETIAIEG